MTDEALTPVSEAMVHDEVDFFPGAKVFSIPEAGLIKVWMEDWKQSRRLIGAYKNDPMRQGDVITETYQTDEIASKIIDLVEAKMLDQKKLVAAILDHKPVRSVREITGEFCGDSPTRDISELPNELISAYKQFGLLKNQTVVSVGTE